MRDMEAATYCTLFLPEDSDIVNEMLAIGRHYSNMMENHREQERGGSHIWYFNSMVKATETTLRSRIGELSPPDQGELTALRRLRTITESVHTLRVARTFSLHVFPCVTYRHRVHAWLKVFAVRLSHLSISHSPFSCFIRRPYCSRTVTSRPPSRLQRPRLLCRSLSDLKALV